MNKSFLIINFKTYEQSRHNNGLKLAKLADSVAKEYSANIIIVPQVVSMAQVAEIVDIPVYSQHLDHLPSGSGTGHIEVESLVEAGIKGTLLNHSERRLEISILEESNMLAKKHGLNTVICAGTIGISKSVTSFEPWAVAMEPPELIGGDVSVTTRPEAVKNTIKAINSISKDVLPLIGAGVKNADHVKAAIELGSVGVLLASGIVKADDPKKIMEDMSKALVNY